MAYPLSLLRNHFISLVGGMTFVITIGGNIFPLYAKPSPIKAAPPPPSEHISRQITQQAITDLSQAMKEGGLDKVTHVISSCYLNTDMGSDLRKKCILEDLALRIFDQRFRAIIFGQTHTDPGPAVSFLADQAVEMRNTLYIYPIFGTDKKAADFFEPALPVTINALTHNEKEKTAE